MNTKQSVEKKIREDTVKIELITSFDCGVYQNAIDIAIALAKAGRFVNIVSSGTGYFVNVYKRQ